MTEIGLYDVPRPVLIVKAQTGVSYYNQVGGCGCFHKSQEGFIIPLWGVNPMEYRAFNHHVWYATYHAAEPPDLNAHSDFPGFDAPPQESQKWRDQVWWEEVVETIEGLRGRDTPRDFVRMKVKKDKGIDHYEAWVEVRALIRTSSYNWSHILKKGVHRSDAKQWVDAILTWQNCD